VGHGDEGRAGLAGYDEWKTRAPEDEYPHLEPARDEEPMPEEMYYHSESKGDVRIGDMATPHLLNAWRKLGGMNPGKDELNTVCAMTIVLRQRGCVLDESTGRWQMPPKEGA
jgi:hypothetical protein